MPRRPNEVLAERVVITHDHAALTGDLTVKLFRPVRQFRVDRVSYVNPTGLAEDASNYFNIKVKNGSTVAANWSTETGAEGTIAADTFVTLDPSATSADLLWDADDEVSVQYDETGTATLPAGRLVIEGRYL